MAPPPSALPQDAHPTDAEDSADSARVVYADFSAGSTAAKSMSDPAESPPSTDDQPPRARTLGYDEREASEEQRKIGDFLIRRLIGEGGMGKVYEAEERLSKRRVALKILRTELARSEQGRRQFVTEMGILARLDDPHVVRCLHCTEFEGQLVMALEYLEGQTLREQLNQHGALAWEQAVDIAWQIASALRAAHASEPAIIHRDLKPENVMLLADGRVKVMDFGIAKIVQAAGGATTHSVGTLQYMSPEQVDAQPLDPRSDLFALGLVLWEMLAGHPPFEAESPRILLDRLCTAPTPELPEHARRGLPRGITSLLARLLEKRPDDRPASADEVVEVLELFRPAEQSRTPSKGRTESLARERGTEPGTRSTGTPTPVAELDSSSAASSSGGKARDTASDEPIRAEARELRPQPLPRERLDTVAVVAKAQAREIPTGRAVMIIFALSLLAGLATWIVRWLAG